MQILVDTETETLAGLLSVIRTLNEVMYARGATNDQASPLPPMEFASDVPAGTNAVPQLPPAAPAAPATAPSVLAAAIAGVESANSGDAPPAGLGFGRPSPVGAPASSTHIASTTAVPVPPAPKDNASLATNISAPVAAPPAALTPNSLTVVPAAERDSAGLPWDARIHSDTHKKNADGSWRFRRNLDEAVKVEVLMELKPQIVITATPPAGSTVSPILALASVPVPPTPPTAAGSVDSAVVPLAAPVMTVPASTAVNVPVPPTVPLPPAQPVGANAVGAGGAIGANVVPQHPVTPPAAVPMPPASPVGVPDAAKPVLLSDLIAKVNKGFGSGTLKMADVTAACEAEGVAGITALAHSPGKVQAVINRLKL